MIQDTFVFDTPAQPAAKGKKGSTKTEPRRAWPAGMLEQTQAVRGVVQALRESSAAITPEAIAERFTRAPRARVQEILQALATLGF